MLTNRKKWVAIIVFDFIAIFAFVLYIACMRTININGIYVYHPKEIHDFDFIDSHGTPFTKKALYHHWTFLYLGFTQCQVICPTTMSTLNKTYQSLQHNIHADQIPNVVFITIDPDNDTSMKLNQYIHSFNANFIAVRAPLKETEKLEGQLSVTTSRSNGIIMHSGDIILINPSAKIQAYFPFPQNPQHLVDDYKTILGQKN